MTYFKNRVIDANINRVTEGLRVIEEYTRFIANHTAYTTQLAELRKKIHLSEPDFDKNLVIRNALHDVRAKEIPAKRNDLRQLLQANFKRVEEGLRVLEEYTGNPIYNAFRYDVYQLEKDIVLTMLKKPILNGVYLISNCIETLKQGLEWGVSMIQLRDKAASKSELLEKAYQLKPLAAQFNIPFIVNDFIDIAILVDADGLHTGQDDISISEIRELLGPHKLIGRTTHTLEQGLKAEAEGADYISIGPLWETPSKPGRQSIGLDYLKLAQTRIHIPYVAIGGINEESLACVMPFNPPMIGLIRAYEAIPQIIRTYYQKQPTSMHFSEK